MAAVYLAEHATVGKTIVLKVLLPALASEPELVESFLREARIASEIHDDHVIDIFYSGRSPEGYVFLAMEYLQGSSLLGLLDAEGPMPWARAKPIFLQICAALGAAHARGVVHRDVKPENVFVVESLPAWRTNRLKRLAQAPKRYILDAGLMAAILRVDMTAILHDAKLLGRIIDTFVASQLRSEIEVCATRPRLYHLRDTDGRHEADIVAELGGERVIGFEVKASSSVTAADARHLAWMRDELGERFVQGVVFHTGPHTFQLGDRLMALPISAIWAAR